MATFEYSGTLKYKDKAGNLHIMKPRTTSGNVEGLTQLLDEKENSGAAATALENAKAYTDQKIEGIPTPDVSAQITAHNESQDAHPYIRGLIPTKTSQIENDSGYLTQHQDISGKLNKPANDATAKAGQLLTKTANGQEWKDREKDLFIVTISVVSNTTYTADKTFLEIQEAYDAGKVCFASITFEGKILLPIVQLVKDTIAAFSASSSDINFLLMIHADNSIEVGSKQFQKYITVTGLLKGNGNGGISSATAGTDYVAPNGDASNVTTAFTAATTRANIATGEKLSVLFGKIAKWFADLGSLAFKSTVAKSDLASDVQASLGKADSALQSAPVTSVNSKTGAVSLAKGDVGLGNVDNVKQYSASNPPPYPVTSVNGKTGAVTVSVPTVPSTTSLIKGNGSGGLVAATRGSDYIASGNIVKQTLVATETTPTENYAINWVYG
ncbi:MAG: hypothetical protein ACOCOG_04995 [Prevotella sp.]